mmetsp:Transcript_13243/g.37394  ORF Transcript_13243/g.37394 Transcript_13243/m.37394 type:complete len:211 (+) Transcript_13243:3943-4575(+)
MIAIVAFQTVDHPRILENLARGLPVVQYLLSRVVRILLRDGLFSQHHADSFHHKLDRRRRRLEAFHQLDVSRLDGVQRLNCRVEDGHCLRKNGLTVLFDGACFSSLGISDLDILVDDFLLRLHNLALFFFHLRHQDFALCNLFLQAGLQHSKLLLHFCNLRRTVRNLLEAVLVAALGLRQVVTLLCQEGLERHDELHVAGRSDVIDTPRF